MSLPSVSIVTVCFNVANELEKTMSSVGSQDYKNLEYIVIDGGSSDNSVEVILSYESRINALGGRLKWVSENDEGIYDAMNKGLDKATGDWVLFMNAGDTFASNDVLNTVFSRPLHPKGDVIFGKSITHYNNFSAIRYSDFGTSQDNWYLSKMPNHQAVFINKSLYSKNRYDLSYKYNSDSVYLIKIFKLASSVIELTFPVSKFELGGKSNYYGDYRTYRTMVSDSARVNGNYYKSLLNHTIKFALQSILRKHLYLTWYIRHLDR